MPNNYILLETIALTQSAASVTFDNLPTSGYTDLKVVMSARTDSTSPNIFFSINGSTSTFTSRALYGDGASAASTSAVPRIVSYASISTNTASTFGNTEIYIPNYRSSNNKSFSVDTVSENNATTAYTGLFAGLWSTVSAITSLTFTPDSGNFVANSTFSLYGIAALGTTPVLAPKATGGNSIENDGTYWIHTFTSSGTFIPQVGLTCDYLVVAGGGGAGGVFNASGVGAGGGAGGYRTSIGGSPLTLTQSTAYNVTVGAGGTGGPGQTPVATNGVDSVFATITSTGGGFGESTQNAQSGSGGSGGGGSSSTSGIGSGNTPSTSPSQGNNGGAGIGTGNFPSGGGGGAGAVGGNASVSVGGVGGAGVANSISGTSVTYAGGGGGGIYNSGTGGAGGAGGGGAAGAPGLPGTSGTANTGGGGGGASSAVSGGTDAGGNGGSGIIIIRYPIA